MSYRVCKLVIEVTKVHIVYHVSHIARLVLTIVLISSLRLVVIANLLVTSSNRASSSGDKSLFSTPAPTPAPSEGGFGRTYSDDLVVCVVDEGAVVLLPVVDCCC